MFTRAGVEWLIETDATPIMRRSWLRARVIRTWGHCDLDEVLHNVNCVTSPQLSTVEGVADSQHKPVENRHQLRKVPRAMRNLS